MTAGRLPMGISPAQECVDAMMAFPPVARPYYDSVLNSHPSQHHLSCSPKISLKGKLNSRNNSSVKDVTPGPQQKKAFRTAREHIAEKMSKKKKEINKSTNDCHVANLKHSTEKI